MSDVDFIKRACENAESVSIDNDTGLYFFGNPVCICDFQSNPLFKKVLLQEAIEGANDKFSIENNGYAILQTEQGITVYFAYHIEKTFKFSDFSSKTETKRSVLKYIFEQEQL